MQICNVAEPVVKGSAPVLVPRPSYSSWNSAFQNKYIITAHLFTTTTNSCAISIKCVLQSDKETGNTIDSYQKIEISIQCIEWRSPRDFFHSLNLYSVPCTTTRIDLTALCNIIFFSICFSRKFCILQSQQFQFSEKLLMCVFDFRDVSGVELLMNLHQAIKLEIDARDESFADCISLGKELIAKGHYALKEVSIEKSRSQGIVI